jgi:glycosyltransferase involved in cell wall biosynthesis
MPNVVLEAMAAGKPVVTTEVEGIAELISPGETGLRVPVAKPEALAAALEHLLAAPEFAAALGVRAQQFVGESFTTTALARKYVELYRGLLAKPS